MSIAWDMDIPSTEKMVLLCLCDYADDNGRSCYPAISTLAKRTSKNARTVQRALRWLEKSKICHSNTRAGTSTDYTIDLAAFVTHDKMSPLTNTTKRGDTTPPNPSRTTTIKKIIAHEIPENWLPDKFGIGTASRSVVDGWSIDTHTATLEAFTAHHRARGSKFKNWQDAWSTWVLNSRKFGNGNTRRTSNNSSGNGRTNGFAAALRHVADGPIDEPFGFDRGRV